MLTYIFLLIFHILLLFLKPCTSSYAEETSYRMNGKLKNMDHELLKDVFMKIQAVQHIRRMYYKNSVFQQGETVYNIRTLYKRMIYYHFKTVEQPELKLSERLRYTYLVQKYKMSIDHHIQMAEGYEEAASSWSTRHEHVEDVLRMGKENTRQRMDQKSSLRTNLKKSWRPYAAMQQKSAESRFDSDDER